MRVYDTDYQKEGVMTHVTLGVQGDVYDRLMVRIEEVSQSIEIIESMLQKIEGGAHSEHRHAPALHEMKLADGYYISRIEGHRGEIFQLIYIEDGKIRYYKCKDPSFVNRTLVEYSVLNNIIADFPICNKSFDLSYS